jgi:RNA polymerase sigma factor (sigma-70 family)
VLAARRADRAAADALLRRHRPLLVALCRRMLGDAGLADDAAQEASLAALLNLARLERPERFGPWLAGIGLNVCRRLLHQRAHQAWSLDELLGGRVVTEPVDPGPTPDELAEAEEASRRVRAAVELLPPGQRAAVVGYYLAGLTVAELAAELGISPGAVKTRLHKGRSALRGDLTPWWRGRHAERRETGMPETGTADELVPMRVADVRRVPGGAEAPFDHWVVVLEQIDGDRRVMIWVGRPEATALALALENAETPRPMSYKFMASLLGAVGGRLREVRIDRLGEGTFYATAVVEAAAGTAEVDARPSDALNLAQITGAPVKVAADVITRAEATAHQAPADPDTTEAMNAAAIAELFRQESVQAMAAYQERREQAAGKQPKG